jgi:hypothetical protein
MAEFLHVEEVPLDEITDIYINELQIKFNTMLDSFEKAIIPADKMEFTVKRELSFVIDLSKKIEVEIGSLENTDNTPLPEANGPISYFEYLAIQSTADDLEPFIPDTIKNKDAYWKRVKLAYRKSLFEGYISFLQGMLNTVFDISRSPEYWNMRTIAEVDKTREAPPNPAPDTQEPEQKAAEGLPPVIEAVLNEGLLDTPVNGKYPKKGDKKDAEIIEWIFNYSGYGDSLTTALYMQYIQTQCKPTTIQDYITRNRKPPD